MRRLLYLAGSLAALGALGYFSLSDEAQLEAGAHVGQGRYRDGRGRWGREGAPSSRAAASSPLLAGLERYYKLNGNGTEEVGAANGVVTGVTWSTGHVGAQAANFANSTTRKIVAPGLDLVTDLTISAWFYATTNGNYATIVANMDGGGGAALNYSLVLNSASVILYGTGNVEYVARVGVITFNAWHHVVFTRTTAGAVTAYYDGAPASTPASTGGPPPHSVPLADLRIGSREDAYSAFPGLIEQVGIWSRLLTSDERATLYNSGAGLPYPF